MTTTVHGVLAGAYKGGMKNLLTHASTDQGTTSICRKVKKYSLCDQELTTPPTCPVCLAKLAKGTK